MAETVNVCVEAVVAGDVVNTMRDVTLDIAVFIVAVDAAEE